MTICNCATEKPRGAKLRTEDERGRPITESLHRVGGADLRVRVLDFGDRVKVTVSETVDDTGDVAEDTNRAHIRYELVMFGGAVVPMPASPDREARIRQVVEGKLRAAQYATLMRRTAKRLLGEPVPEVAPCATCGGEPAIRDGFETAVKRSSPDGNPDLVIRSPRGNWLRLRCVRTEHIPEGVQGQEGAGFVQLLVSAAACDETGDVLRDDIGHIIFPATSHVIPTHALMTNLDGRPLVSEEGVLADRLASFAMASADAQLAARARLMRLGRALEAPWTVARWQRALDSERTLRGAEREQANARLAEKSAEVLSLSAALQRQDNERIQQAAELARARARIQELEGAAKEAADADPAG